MNINKHIDVIIPVHNCERFIGEAIESILRQTWKNLSIIVVDDGSTDSTSEIVLGMIKKDIRVSLISPGKVGLPSALNLGIERSKAPYISFLDADDLWETEKLEKQMAFLINNPEFDVCFTMIKEFESFQQNNVTQKFRAREEPMKGLVRGTFLGKHEIFEKYGKFDPNIEMGEFIQWLSPAIRDGYKYHILPEVLALRRIHSNNMTRKATADDYLKLLKSHLAAKKKNESK